MTKVGIPPGDLGTPPAGVSAPPESSATPWRRIAFYATGGWVVARLVVAISILLAIHGGHGSRHMLLGWDAAALLRIAQIGYPTTGDLTGLRFFPLTPLLASYTSGVFGGRVDLALLVESNLAALVYAVLLGVLVWLEFRDRGLAGRSAWLVALVPAGFVLVMGYAEPLFGVLSVLLVMAVRARRWALAIPAGILAGLDRPMGLLLCAFLAVEALREFRPRRSRSGLGRINIGRGAVVAAAVASPVIGTAAYCGWVWHRLGNPWLPFTTQHLEPLRGGVIVTPLMGLHKSWVALLNPAYYGINALRLPTLAVLIVLLIIMGRRQPPSYLALAVATLAAAVTSDNWGSLLRYSFTAFPFVIALAQVGRTRRTWVLVTLGSVALLLLFGTQGFSGRYVP